MYKLSKNQLSLVAGGSSKMIIENHRPAYLVTDSSVYKATSIGNNGLVGILMYANRVEDTQGNIVFSGSSGSFSFNGLDYVVSPIDGGNKYSIVI